MSARAAARRDALAAFGVKTAAPEPPAPTKERRTPWYDARAQQSGVESAFQANADFDRTSPMETPGVIHRLEG